MVLVVTGDDLGVGRGNALVLGAALAGGHDALLLGMRLVGRSGSRPGGALGAVIHAALGGGGLLSLGLGLVLVLVLVLLVMLLGALGALDVDVGNAAAGIALVWGKSLVLERRLGVLGDDVPGVDQAGNVAKDTEEDVNDRVGAADAALDPDCEIVSGMEGVGGDLGGGICIGC